MSDIRELSFDEIELVSGGNANGQDAGERSNYGNNNARNTLGRNAPTHIYSDPSTVACANQAFGAITSLPNVGRTAARMVGAAAQCLDLHAGSGRGGDAGSANCSGNSAAGTCNRP